MTVPAFGTPEPHEDQQVDDALGRSLHFPNSIHGWYERLGRENFCVVRDAGRVVAGAALSPAGQWFGGRQIPTVLVNGVGVLPEARGGGTGRALLQGVLHHIHRQGVPLATLYPSTTRFYRTFGFERAGTRITYDMPTDACAIAAPPLDIAPFYHEDGQAMDAVRQVQRQSAIRGNGALERPAWMWTFRMAPPVGAQTILRYLISRAGQAVGYVVLNQGTRTDPLKVIDYAVTDSDAAKRLLALLGGYRTMNERVWWNGGHHDDLLLQLPETLVGGMKLRYAIQTQFDWMVRMVDVASALAARGYPPGLAASLHLDIRDELLTHNAGRGILQIADGTARYTPGGEGRIAMDIRVLTGVFTGMFAPAEAAMLGLLRGPAADLALMGAVFAGPRPATPDMF